MYRNTLIISLAVVHLPHTLYVRVGHATLCIWIGKCLSVPCNHGGLPVLGESIVSVNHDGAIIKVCVQDVLGWGQFIKVVFHSCK